MKRSEMVEKLKKPVSLLTGGALRDDELQEAAGHLLDLLEDYGMQPPNINLSQLVPNSGLISNEDAQVFYSCWEPENEEK